MGRETVLFKSEEKKMRSEIANTLVHLSKQHIVNHIGWAQYVITDLGREQYKRHPRTPHDPSSEESA